MKKSTFSLCSFTLLLLYLLYFLWQPYPRSLFKSLGNFWVYQDIITNLIFFFIFFLFLAYAARVLGKPAVYAQFFSRESAKLFFCLLGIHLSLDLAAQILASYAPNYARFIWDCFPPACWALSVLALKKILGLKCQVSFKGRCLLLGLPLLVLFGCLAFDTVDFFRRQELIEKYVSGSYPLDSALLNMDYRWEVRNMLLDFSCGIFSFLYFMLSGQKAGSKPEEKYGEGTRTVLRMLLMSGAFFLVFLVKAIILPNNAILPTYMGHYGTVLEYKLPEEVYDISYSDVFTISRADAYGGEVPVYCTSKITVWYNGEDFFSFKTDGYYTGGGGPVTDEILSNCWQEVQLGSVKAAIFAGREIAWVSGSEKVHIQIDKIPDADENAVLTALCLDRVSNGDWRFFEHGLEYLLKYEPDFIMPYIQRYADGKFTDRELKYSRNYNPNYIQELAMAALNI